MMTPTRTTRASRAGSSTSSPKGFSNLSMTVAFKSVPSERKRSKSPATKQAACAYTSDHVGGPSQVDEDEDDAKEDGNVEDDLAGHVVAPPAHLDKVVNDAGFTLDDTNATLEIDGLAGLENYAVPASKNEDELGNVDLPRRPSTSDLTDSDVDISDMEFDVPDDDDDYGAVDQVDASDDEVGMDESEAAHLACNVNDWSEQDVEVEATTDDAVVNWDDQRTYDFEFPYPYSEPFSDTVEPSLSLDVDMGTCPSRDILTPPAAVDYDPHMGPNLFKDRAEQSSRSSSASAANSEPGEASQTSPTESSAPRDDDTESEDLNEEIQRRLQMLKERKERKKRKSSKKKRRSSDQDRPATPSASKIKKFSKSSRRVQVLPKSTSSGRVIYLSIPKNTHIRWLVGRIPIDPAQHANSPELTRSLRSRMFQQAYCPGPSDLDMWRQIILSFPRDNTYQQYAHRPLRLRATPSPAPGIGDGAPHVADFLQQHDNSLDFTGVTDTDGVPGLTLFQSDMDDYLNINDEDDDETPNSPDLQSRRISELGEANSMDFEHVEYYDEVIASETDVESPCPKRRRTIEPGNSGFHLENANQITV